MSDESLVLTGRCACGAIRYRAQGPVQSHVLCHCESCRRATGALYVPWFTVPLATFAFTAGEPAVRQSSSGVIRRHCTECGTALTYENSDCAKAGEPAIVDITTCSLDEPDALAPDAHIWSEDDLQWSHRLGQLPVYRQSRSDETLEVPAAIHVRGLVLRQVSFAAAHEALLSVRIPVFVAEQGVPPEIEADDRDASCIHLLATIDEKPVATARLDLAKGGKIGRVAVLGKWRGEGVGRALMLSVHRIAAGHGLANVWCNAQLSAVSFYEKLGYQAEGETFVEAGIIHRTLRYRFASD